ncbi:glycosyl hydrolase [Bacteroidia bacterium]|nr:glycosyl hydrolase [Bacteroidia bacterium]GHT47886.1 glycosyl hydrolase [Bacteroidia bacterium]
MKTKTLVVMSLVLFCSLTALAQKNNTLTEKEKSEGWTLLFDGTNMNGWRQCNKTEMAKNWVIDDEAMKVQKGSVPGRGSEGDILFATKKYSNFVLSIDWKIETEGNSGIFYNIVEFPGRPIYIAAPEVQVLDNWNAGDTKLTNHLAGSLYDMLPALPSNANPAYQWNNITITVYDGHVTHVQNGVLVCEYTLWTPEWDALVQKSKFKDWPEFIAGVAKEGYIGLQDHGYDCWFRNIKIKELK